VHLDPQATAGANYSAVIGIRNRSRSARLRQATLGNLSQKYSGAPEAQPRLRIRVPDSGLSHIREGWNNLRHVVHSADQRRKLHGRCDDQQSELPGQYTGTLVIAKANASATPNAASKTYGQRTPRSPDTGRVPRSGWRDSNIQAGRPERTVAGDPIRLARPLSPAGALVNYNITSSTASFTINKANASVTPNAASKTTDSGPALTGH